MQLVNCEAEGPATSDGKCEEKDRIHGPMVRFSSGGTALHGLLAVVGVLQWTGFLTLTPREASFPRAEMADDLP